MSVATLCIEQVHKDFLGIKTPTSEECRCHCTLMHLLEHQLRREGVSNSLMLEIRPEFLNMHESFRYYSHFKPGSILSIRLYSIPVSIGKYLDLDTFVPSMIRTKPISVTVQVTLYFTTNNHMTNSP